ncbi:MAG: hypothetical protein HOB22_01165 [Candidatus Marinimicrobia bacterium]|nr:hypothetical protein [Candidatus Neomarinimicrobiota bacterium]
MKNTRIFILLIAVLISACGEDRPRSNPFDPETELSPDDWAPTNLQAEVLNDSEIKLTWTQEETRISGFRISRKAGNGTYTQIAELGENVTEYTDSGLSLDTDYTYRVKAYTDMNESGNSISEVITLYYDCLSVFMGTAAEDCSGECNGTAVEDCSGECNGTAVEDCSGECNGTAVEDCNNDCNGSAFANSCEYCIGGNTGLDESYCGIVTDIDGNEYGTVLIGNQVWMSENLKVTKYKDGTAIPTGHSNSVWSNLSSGAYAVYDDDDVNTDTYGFLYNWYAVDDSRIIAPDGWHVPTDDEWTTLTDYLGGTSVSGGKMKETGTEHWSSPNTDATNESGFTALPGGYRYFNGNYIHQGYSGYFWSSTEYSSNSAWYRTLNYNYSDVDRGSNYKKYGFSLRCVRD